MSRHARSGPAMRGRRQDVAGRRRGWPGWLGRRRRERAAEVAGRRLRAVLAAPTRAGWVPEQTFAHPEGEAMTGGHHRVEPEEPDEPDGPGGPDRAPVEAAARTRLDRRAVAVVVAVLAAAVLLAVVVGWRSRPQSLVVATTEGGPPAPTWLASGGAASGGGPSAGAAGRSGSAPSHAAASPTPSTVVVHVAGLVKHPGLVTLPAGARVADAVQAAGGVARGGDAATVNLARPLQDGEQLVVRASGAPPPASGPGSSGGETGPVDLNAASEAQLEGLPGVGPVLAGRIVAWRSEHGRFTSVDQLQDVSGIGDKLFAAISPLVRV